MPEGTVDESLAGTLSESTSDETREPAGAGKTEGADPARNARQDRERNARVTYNFYAGVNAQGGVFGVQDGGERRDGGRRRVTGSLSAEDLAEADRYAEPECFADAVRKLRQRRVLVVEGRPGIGRRSGAISLLLRAGAAKLVVLSPSLTLRDLAERDYQAGYGYLVFDRTQDRIAGDLEFTWSNVSEQVREAGAFLVLTSSQVGTASASAAVPHVAWQTPPPADVLRHHLKDLADADRTVEELVTELPDDCPPARLVTLARLIRDEGRSAREALRGLDEGAVREVREWFARKPAHREVVAVAALCFLEGADVRTFDTLLVTLHDALAGYTSGKKRKKPDLGLLAERRTLAEGCGLLELRDLPDRVGSVQQIVFRDEAYRRHVLGELWRSMSVSFWDAVRDWLAVAVGTDTEDTTVSVASGIAWLACVSFTEVERSYLEPWSQGAIGWPGQVAATYVLWFMCHREGLPPAALQTAVRWSQGRDIESKWTAALAFGGELGMCFPSDAVNKLWHLTSQQVELWPVGCASLAELFAALNDDPHGDAGIVLNLLDVKMNSFGPAAPQTRMHVDQFMRLRDLTMAASLEVLCVDSIRHRRPAIFDYLERHPERVTLVARIWAGLVVYRPLRWETFKALRRGLHALRDISADPPERAREFGAALSAALPQEEHLPFKNDFIQADDRLRRGRHECPAEVLLACLNAITVQKKSRGDR